MGTFQNFKMVAPSVGPRGEVAFLDVIAGVFAEDPDTGVLSTVINYDTRIDGQGILNNGKGIGFGTQAYSNGLASAYIVLENTTCGIWTLPVTQTKSVPTI